MKKYPNTSYLTLITQSEGIMTNEKGCETENKECNEKLLFIFLKTVPDFYASDKIYWYEGKGKDGKAICVWEHLSIRQWVACGKDTDITQLFDSIISKKKFIIGKTEIILSISAFNLNPCTVNAIKNRGETIYDSLSSANNNIIPHEFYQKENLKFLSGYKVGSAEIKPLFPLGFFEDNFIYENLKEGIWGIREYRSPNLSFRGVRATSEKGIGSNEIVGFYQQVFESDSTYIASIKNEEDKEIGQALIDKNTGIFKIGLSEPTKNGKVEIFVNDKKEKAIEYVLLQDIQFTSNIANKTYKDAYGRNFMITSDKKDRPSKMNNFTWQRSVYSDSKEADQKLSDQFKSLIDFLGPKILIADPYFIGDFKQDNTTKIIEPSHCQKAFINAVFHSAVEKEVNQLYILGNWKRAKKQVENNDASELDNIDQLFLKYEKIFKHNISINNLKSYLPPSTIIFRNAKEDFHNRYWFSLKDEDGVEILDKCVIITNSIGNINEVDIIPIPNSEESQLKQITRKYTGLFKNSEVKLSI